jgi:hypothetical protein
MGGEDTLVVARGKRSDLHRRSVTEHAEATSDNLAGFDAEGRLLLGFERIGFEHSPDRSGGALPFVAAPSLFHARFITDEFG